MISFQNTENAFAYKSDKELKRARFLFNLMNNKFMLNLGLNLLPGTVKLGVPMVRPLVKNTIFKQFVGGETLHDTVPVVNKLADYGVQVILDYGVEGGHDGERGFDDATDQFLRVIDFASRQPNIPFMSIKVTGIARIGLLEKITAGMRVAKGDIIARYKDVVNALTGTEREEWSRVVIRFERICECAVSNNVGVMVDAEESWIHDPVDALVMLMMETHNKQKAIVFNTYQLYRHDRLPFLKENLALALQKGFILGAKLVRGAYMEKERERAREKNYPSPIQPDKSAADADYNAAVEYCLQHLDHISFTVASHNEESNSLTVKRMQELGLDPRHPHVHFSQLFGMSDHISFNLAKEGYSVSKYVPFGPIRDVIPYLMRRAEENSSVAGQTGGELALINAELRRRKNK